MTRKREICGKGKIFGNTVPFSHHRGSRTWSPDVHRVHTTISGSPERIYVCTRCLRSRKVKGAL